MTTEHQASRTVLKSPPELWAECSDAGSLARHIGEFGEIRITRLEPETTVAWEGDHASGTVEIEPSGWGTKVTMTASAKAEEMVEEPAVVIEEPAAVVEEPAAVVEEPAAVVQEPAAVVREPPNSEIESIKEAVDAEVEETSKEPDPAVAPYPVPARRWMRMITRTKALFSARATPAPAPVVPPDIQVSPQSFGAQYRISVLEANASREARPVAPPADAKAERPADAKAERPADAEAERPADAEAERPTDAEAERPTDPAEPRPAEAETRTAETAEPRPETAPAAIDPAEVIAAALHSLGQAHHRPFSRA